MQGLGALLGHLVEASGLRQLLRAEREALLALGLDGGVLDQLREEARGALLLRLNRSLNRALTPLTPDNTRKIANLDALEPPRLFFEPELGRKLDILHRSAVRNIEITHRRRL